ncbi:MAG: carbohydrate porin [Gammaproteobacteria bacterium]|nr:carbohydrate porin [Gammaproteobacteria bacterium]
MRISLMVAATAMLFAATSATQAQETEIELLRAAIDELRADYDARIAELEQRLAVAEQNVSSTSRSSRSAFNPAIGVIFQGQAWNFSREPDDYIVQGFPFGGEAGPISEGLGIGETELIMNANVDDKFAAYLTAALALEDGESVLEIEEAWVEATALPAGFGARFGRFFSGIGYLNKKHSHSWDFADQPLPYQAFLGDQYLDNGVQLRWLAPTDLYVELGAEWLQGSRYPAGGNANSGYGSRSLFANIGGDVSASSSWLAGISYLDSKAIDRPSGDENDPLVFNGDSTLSSAQFVWKWAPNGNWKQKNLVIQSEFFWRDEDGDYAISGAAPLLYDVAQTGWYAQAVYQPLPRWRFGGRVDGLSTDDPGVLFDGTPLAAPQSDPMRYSLMFDWSNSEFSRLRLQFTRDEAGPQDGTEWGLQYIHSIGAHGAHAF